MPVQKESRWDALMAVLREGLPALRLRLTDWVDACRQEPAAIWHTPAVRYTVFGVGGLIAVWIVASIIGGFGPPDAAVPFARTADFRVICTNPACNHAFVINRSFSFDDFPVTCPECGKKTGVKALRCFSASCKGRWVAPRVSGQKLVCPRCGKPLADQP